MKDPLRVLVADDEAPARLRLSELVGRCGSLVVAEAASGDEVLAQSTEWDVALLDVRMPGMDGLECARQLNRRQPPPVIIFVTAFDDFALQAFEVNAVSYLVKPVRESRLCEALERARALLPGQMAAATLAPRRFLHAFEEGCTRLLPVDGIRCLYADQKYVVACCDDGEHLLDESLTHLEEELAGRFLRIHRSCLVAPGRLRALKRDQGGWLAELDDGSLRPVSRRQLPAVRSALGLAEP